MTAEAAGLGPGVYCDLPLDDYLADPVAGGSLSRSGGRLMLPPNAPAIFRWRQDHPQDPKDDFDFGHAAHGLVLGDGPPVDVIDAPDRRTKAVQQKIKDSRAAGRVPVMIADWRTVEDMAAAIKAHPIASKLLDPWSGTAEPTLIWRDPETGIMLRCRPDFLPFSRPRQRMIIPDYKTAKSSDPDEFMRSVIDYGYHMQAAWLIDGVEACGLGKDPAVVFIAQEKTAPYLVTVIELDARALRIGRSLMRQAIDIYQRCQRTGRWPGHASDVVLAEFPTWYLKRFDED